MKLFASELDRSMDSYALCYRVSFPALNVKRLGVTYMPASAVDAQLIQSYIDQGEKSLPVYLLHVKPVIQLDGVGVAAGPYIGMGLNQYWDTTVFDPQGSSTATESFSVSAGDEMVFGVNGIGITQEVIKPRASAWPSDTAAENLHQVALHYWMEHDLLDGLTARTYRANILRLPSLGLFSSPLSVNYFLGIPRSGTYRGRQMDVKRSYYGIAAKTNEERAGVALQIGLQGSYLEGAIFEQLFARPSGHGVSAAQALQVATGNGSKVRMISDTNIDAVLPLLKLSSDVKGTILSAVNSGKLVVTPDEEVTIGRWQGAGYIVLDTQTGAGAYLIEGGGNGGFDPDCDDHPAPLVQVIVGIALVVVLVAIIRAILPAAIAAIVSIGNAVRPILIAMTVGTGMLLASQAEAASFNRNQCCENAKRDAAGGYNNLRRRLDEWYENKYGLHDRGHWDAIEEATVALENALKRVASNCRRPPTELDIWTATVLEGKAFISTVPRP